jgi:glutamate/tyrosine decarboxylase-like PLP-dependent enzyme/quercetin dioxygenase-like cupin family protein
MTNVNKLEPLRTVLFESEMFEVVSIEWSKTIISEMHSHGWSQCHVLVQSGVFENYLDLGLKTETAIFETGQVISTPVGSQHELRCVSDFGKTLHIYMPRRNQSVGRKNFRPQMPSPLLENLNLGEASTFEQTQKILQLVKNESITTDSVFFMNQLFSGILPQAILAQDIISKTRTTLATLEASPVFSAIEQHVVQSLGQLIGWADCEGVNVPGGSAANFMALHCARQQKCPDFKRTGFDHRKFKIYVSSEAHYSMKKACMVLGFGTDSLVQIAAHENGKINSASLEIQIIEDLKNNFEPLFVCATSGTTVHGAFDSISELSVICNKYDIWLHIDAAWGGPAMFSEQLKEKMKGVHFAKSLTFDAHKLFGANLTCSFFVTSQKNILIEANDVSGADYLFHDKDMDRGKMSWQCGRGADAVVFWTIWKNVGTQGLSDFVSRLLKVRDESVAWIKKQDRLDLIVEPEYLNICVRIKPHSPETLNWSMIAREKLIDDQFAMVNYSKDKNGPFLRLILAHPNLEFKHVKEILSEALSVIGPA